MIPVKLTIEGLYSYQERQTIDFSQLTKAGLFGIFGAVGSGKSSILEAITFALYGETERLNKTDKRAYNMMNLKSSRSYIEFDFFNHQNKLFRIIREYKRNSRNFEKIDSASKVIFYEQVVGEWHPLSHTDIQQVINLTYDNFKRTIIIPQGKFREFIDLAPAERTRMMKEIYHLHRFDLQDNLKAILHKNQNRLSYIEGNLKGFEEVSEEKIQEQEEKFLLHKEEEKKLQEKYESQNERFQRLKILKDDFEKLEDKRNEFKQLCKEKEQIAEQEKTLNFYEKVYNHFSEPLFQLEKNKHKVNDLAVELKTKKTQLQEIEKQKKEIENRLDILKTEYENLPRKLQEETDLELIAKIHQYNDETADLRNRIEKGETLIKETEEIQETIERNIKQYEKEIENENTKKIDLQILSDIGNWFINAKNIKLNIEKHQISIEKYQNKINEIDEKLNEYPFSLDKYKDEFKAIRNSFEQTRKDFELEKNNLEVQKRLSQYANDLHDGVPCPLCGALEHPQIHTENNISEKLLKINNEIEKSENHYQILQTQYEDFRVWRAERSFLATQMKNERESLDKCLESNKKHLNNFIWKEFSSQDEHAFENQKKISIDAEDMVKKLMKNINNERILNEENKKKLKQYRERLEKLKLEENEKKTKIVLNQNNIKYLKYEDYLSTNSDKIIQLLEILKKSNKDTEKDYENFIEKQNKINIEIATKITNFQYLEKNLDEFKNEQERLNQIIHQRLMDNGISSLQEVMIVLNSNRNILKERECINNFKIKFQTLDNSVKELEEKLKNISFNEQFFINTEKDFYQLTLELNEKTKLVANIQSEIVRLKHQLNKKKELLKECKVLKNKVENLTIMKSLFIGAGFVQYASFVYLRQLCDEANRRFQRMTKNQLSLQFSENGGFEIIDYLNDGRVRSVKTLSGGQYFQVALSLALALADSVQTEAKNEKRFFFIDEGFGALDSESINIIFETLNNLNNENKIVGVISHIEELKERIPTSIKVIKDEQKGSIIYLK